MSVGEEVAQSPAALGPCQDQEQRGVMAMRLVGSQEAFEGLNSLGRECSWDKAESSKGLHPLALSPQPNSQPGHLPIMESRERPHSSGSTAQTGVVHGTRKLGTQEISAAGLLLTVQPQVPDRVVLREPCCGAKLWGHGWTLPQRSTV